MVEADGQGCGRQGSDMPSMLLPPQFHAAVSPGFIFLLLLMLTETDLRE